MKPHAYRLPYAEWDFLQTLMTQALALANVLRYGLVDNMGDPRERRETENGCQIALCRALSDAIAHLDSIEESFWRK